MNYQTSRLFYLLQPSVSADDSDLGLNNSYCYIPRVSLNNFHSWSCAPDQIRMYPDRDTIAQLLPARRIHQHMIV